LDASPAKIAVVPVPVDVDPPGVAVTVQVPEAGNPLSATLPVAREQVGCVTAPAMGAAGVSGWAVTVAVPEAADVQPEALVTVNV
jgi:hypothetical protein